jgi:spermidine synthase
LGVRESLGTLRDMVQGDADGPGRAPHFLMLYFVLPAALILPPTLLMGASFPVLQRVVQTDLARLGRRVGLLQLANVAGSVLGATLVGWVALDAMGTAGTIKALTALSAAFLLPLAALRRAGRQQSRPRLAAPAALFVSIVGVLMLLPDSRVLGAWLHGATGSHLIAGEDGSGLSVLRLESGQNPAVTVFVNGKGQSTMPYGDVQTALGMLPVFLHPDPRDAAIIGLGSGNTAYAVAGRQELTRIVSVEIIRSQLDGLRALRTRYPYGGLAGLLDDRRIEHQAGDGRTFLLRAGPTFDIIEADALRPRSAYSGYLYSVEYFELVRSRLRRRGLAATWAPTARVRDTFVRVFPYAVVVPGILIGSNEPIDLDPRVIAARLGDARVRAHYARAGIDALRMMREHLLNPTVYRPDFDRSALTDVNTDLFPKDEFDLRSAR